MIDAREYPSGIPALSAYLQMYAHKEGRAEADEKVLDWLVPLFELIKLRQNVGEALYNIEVACTAAHLDFKTLKRKAQYEAAPVRRPASPSCAVNP